MKTLVFLHGAGSHKDAYADAMRAAALVLKADVVSLNAPIPHPDKPGRYIWFRKRARNGRRDAVKSDFDSSVRFVQHKIAALDRPSEDIIVVGHSQGGAIAAAVGLRTKLNRAVSICGDMPYNLSYRNLSDTPIYWLEGGKDDYITAERKESYALLRDAPLRRIMLPRSTHTDFADDLMRTIKKWAGELDAGAKS